jgi:hypothetical protein
MFYVVHVLLRQIQKPFKYASEPWPWGGGGCRHLFDFRDDLVSSIFFAPALCTGGFYTRKFAVAILEV